MGYIGTKPTAAPLTSDQLEDGLLFETEGGTTLTITEIRG